MLTLNLDCIMTVSCRLQAELRLQSALGIHASAAAVLSHAADRDIQIFTPRVDDMLNPV